MIVLRSNCVMRSVLRIELPSSRSLSASQRCLIFGYVRRVQERADAVRVSALALRAAERREPVAMFPKALTIDVAGFASHCFIGFCLAVHGYKIQLSLVVCQEKSARNCKNKYKEP